jgi:hypothetical protein
MLHICYKKLNILYDKPTQQPSTELPASVADIKAHDWKQFRVSSVQSHMYVPQFYCNVNCTTMISACVTLILLLPSRYVIILA